MLHTGLPSLLSYTIQNQLSRGGSTYSDLGLPLSVINQENAPKALPTGQSDEDNSSVETSFSLVTLDYITLTNISQHTMQLNDLLCIFFMLYCILTIWPKTIMHCKSTDMARYPQEFIQKKIEYH